MTKRIKEIYNEYISKTNIYKRKESKKTEELLQKIVRPWIKDKHFNFEKYKKSDFNDIQFKKLHCYYNDQDHRIKKHENVPAEEIEK